MCLWVRVLLGQGKSTIGLQETVNCNIFFDLAPKSAGVHPNVYDRVVDRPGVLRWSKRRERGLWETNRRPYKNVPYNKKACVLWVGVGAPPRESMVLHHHTIQTRAMTHF